MNKGNKSGAGVGARGTMHAAVASLETTLRGVVARSLTHAELLQRELEAQRNWRIESAKRHVRRSSPPGGK